MSASWLPADVPSLERRIVVAALDCVGVCEEPLGSNTGPEIDEWNRAAGVPVKSYWCASFAAAVWKASGAQLPPYPASCDSWMTWAKRHGYWRPAASVGCVVLYGVPGDAKHMGIVVRTVPQSLSVEGNAAVESGRFERNGTTVALKKVTDEDPVLGYVVPTLRQLAAAAA